MITKAGKKKKDFLREGDFKSYLWYALSEVLLVVLGILLAIYTYQAIGKMQDRSTENAYAIDLLEDLEQDAASLMRAKKLNERKILGLDSLLQLKNSDFTDPQAVEALYRHFSHLSGIYTFTHHDRTLHRLEQTGEFALLRSKVADSLSSLRTSIQTLQEQQEFYKTALFNALQVGMKTIEFSLYVDSTYYLDNQYTGKSFPPPNEAHLEEFFNHVTLCWGITSNYTNLQLESHLRRNESFKAFLKSVYQIP